MSDTTHRPGPGLIAEEKPGTWSGERFLLKVLVPEYKAARDKGQILRVDLDGTSGYGPSFIREAFKGLVRETRDRAILDNIEIVFDDDPYRKEELLGLMAKGIEELGAS